LVHWMTGRVASQRSEINGVEKVTVPVASNPSARPPPMPAPPPAPPIAVLPVTTLLTSARLPPELKTPPPNAAWDLIVYPKNGQSTEQRAADRYECHNWAKSQTGFDPTQSGGGVPPGSTERSHANYDRAMSACLTARGYEVK